MTHTIFFNKIYVLESLRVGEDQTGTALYQDLLRYMVEKIEHFSAQLIIINSKVQFFAAIDAIYNEIDPMSCRPYLHFEVHGSKEGLVLNSAELLSWDELYNHFRKINFVLKNQLFISLATCYGAYLFNAIDPTKQSPFFGFVGNSVKIYSEETAVGFYEYFERLLETMDLNAAIDALNGANPELPVPYISVVSESVFQIASGKMNEQSKTRQFKLAKRKELEKMAREDPAIKGRYSKSELKLLIKDRVNRRDKDLKKIKEYFLFKRDSPAL